jgi:hypothetical protein
MQKIWFLMSACAFTLAGLSSAAAALPTAVYVDAQNGSNSNAGIGCPITAPCADLNTALSVISAGGSVIVLKAGIFGPIILTGSVNITGYDPNSVVEISANPSANVGCIGQAPAATCGGHSNSGYAVEIAVAATDTVKIGHLAMVAGNSGGAGGLKFSSGGKIQIAADIFRGSGTATTPIVDLSPNTPGTQAQVYFSNSDVGFNNSNSTGGGAVSVQPIGTTSLKLHFNHVEVHNASYGIRTDGSSLTSGAVVATFISESEFFSFPNAAVNAFSIASTGTVNAVFDTTRILNAGTALKANGPASFVILTNNTVSGNGIGVQVTNGATVATSVNNTITGNGPTNNQNVVGTITPAPLQ